MCSGIRLEENMGIINGVFFGVDDFGDEVKIGSMSTVTMLIYTATISNQA